MLVCGAGRQGETVTEVTEDTAGSRDTGLTGTRPAHRLAGVHKLDAPYSARGVDLPGVHRLGVLLYPWLLKNTAARAGTVMVKEWDRACSGTGTASTPPPLPQSPPPYQEESLLRISCQYPPRGAPTR